MDAETISVFRFRFYDGHSERPEVALFKPTREAIAELRGKGSEDADLADKERDVTEFLSQLPES